MTTRGRSFLIFSLLIAGLGLIFPAPAGAQTFTDLFYFNSGTDGANPAAGLLLSGNTLYGTTVDGGSSGQGTVYEVNTDGSGYITLYNFTGGSDGANPMAGLVLSGNTLYGTTEGGGFGEGTVFAVNTDGSGFTNLYSFSYNDGAQPEAGLVLSGNTLYGTTESGGTNGNGEVFSLNTDGTDFTNLYSFTGGSDGSLPEAGLILSGETLYGAAKAGGFGYGTVFALNTNGTGFATVYSFNASTDGESPVAGLILAGNTLYGTTEEAGGSGYGTVFAVNTDGTGFATLHEFTGSDGGKPEAALVLLGNILYGTASYNSVTGDGAIFAVNTNGTGFTNVFDFPNYFDGSSPEASLTVAGLTLYGTTYSGGNNGNGAVFSVALPCPAITLNPAIVPGGRVSANYDVAITPTGGVAPFNFALTSGSALPNGVTLSAGGVVSGVPNSTGTFAFGVVATDANGCSTSNSYTLNVGPSPFAGLYSFSTSSSEPPYSNSDGIVPTSVILAAGTLYGTASQGGTSGSGALFSINTDGSDFKTLHDFAATSGGEYYLGSNADGANPSAGLVLAGETLYGTALYGGANGTGSIFAVNTNGTGFRTLYSFSSDAEYTNSDGAYPISTLILDGDTLYGTAANGGAYGSGTVFAINTNGQGFATLYSFTGGGDGGDPTAGLVLSGNTLYGTAQYGGDNDVGTVFALTTDGTQFSNLYSFSTLNENSSGVETNGDGAYPGASLILSGNTLYGTANGGGANGNGAVFAVNTDGTDFAPLYSFTAQTLNSENQSVNEDGAYPNAPLTLSGNTLFGTANNGGIYSYGTVFAINTDGSDFRAMYDFDYVDGAGPDGGLALAQNTLYGAASYGGSHGEGEVFSISSCPDIILTPAALPQGNVGVSYTQTFNGGGGVAPYTFAITGGSLPDGLSLSSGGILSGQPATIGSFNFTLTAADAHGCQAANSYSVTIFAQFTLLHGFSALSMPSYDDGANNDGANPYGGLVLSGDTLYGTAEAGGVSGWGTVFGVNADGTGFTNLHSFDFSDGAYPDAGLLLSGSTLSGPTELGGGGENGTLFSVNTSGTGFATVYTFKGQSDGYEPEGKLLLAGTNFFGAAKGGNSYSGTLFEITPGNTNATTLHTFTGTGSDGLGSDGALVLLGSTLYGTSPGGGSSHDGIIFSVTTNGMNFTTLHNFISATDGSSPNGGLVLAGNTLYGTANNGGNFDRGTVFSIQTDGSAFTVLYNFSSGGIYSYDNEEYLTNSDGAYPAAGLLLAGNTLYGPAESGGFMGVGTVFALHTNGGGFTTLYSFTNRIDGAFPQAPLILAGNTLYGTSANGGTFSNGTVFALGLGGTNTSIPPIITWNPPAPIIYGSSLGSNQLDATANVPGNFAYSPAAGTVLPNIGFYTLSVVFTPNDLVHYTTATNSVHVTVLSAPLTVTANNDSRRQDSSNPAFTGTIVGAVNGDNFSATYTSSASYNSPPGAYPIVPTLVDTNNRATNYTITLINGTLTVVPVVAIFNVVHGFSAVSGNGFTNADGAGPLAALVISGDTLYGAASSGGTAGSGDLFSVNTSNLDFTNLFNFPSQTAGCCGYFQNSEGMSPSGTLVLSGTTLYGPAKNGGNGYVGALFDITTNGSSFSVLHAFQNVSINGQNYPENNDGAFPYAGFVLSNGTLYGTAIFGGSQGVGVVFRMNTDGSDFTNLHSFSPSSDGSGVFGGLVLSSSTLYGTAQGGGTNGDGTLFALNTDGTDFRVLHNFASTNDGAGPDCTLLLAGNTLYGTTADGGTSSNGTVFALNTNGAGFTILHNFTALNNNTNFDGAKPLAGVILSTDGTMLYGTATGGGASGYGVVFAINTNGTGFTNLYSFTDGADGSDPQSALVAGGLSLYGTAAGGGPADEGTIYSLVCMPPLLSIALDSGYNFDTPEVVLTWPVSLAGFSYGGFQLQSTTDLNSPSWSNVYPLPTVVNVQYTVNVPIRPTQEFFRLYEHINQ